MGVVVAWSIPALAMVQIQSILPSVAAPQVIGATITFTVTASDTDQGPLAFRFNIAPPGGHVALVKDFNLGTYNSGAWTALPFVWTPTGIEGVYQIQVIAKDFASGHSASANVSYQVNPLVAGTAPVVVATANPLVALFSVPPCPAGSHIRAKFKPAGATAATATPWAVCRPATTTTFEIAGMYPKSTYQIFSQTDTAGKIVNGRPVSFTTGSLPGTPIPKFTLNLPAGAAADLQDSIVLEDLTMSGQAIHYPEVATDLSGNILWYYYSPSSQDLVTRPLPDGLLIIESGPAWNPASQLHQLLRQIDWAGNIVRETNTGAIQQELLALGATDAQPCTAIPTPAPVGSACLGEFGHDFIHTLPNGYSAAIVDIEKIFPPGTQGDTTGLPVDIVGDMIVVLDQNWQAVWYFDAFEHAGGPPQLSITRQAVLNETCVVNQPGCPPIFLLGNGIAPLARDWLHANSLYYWPAPQDGLAAGDLIWSSRHQDWVMRVDYQDGAGTGNILWRMGLDGDFLFNNVNSDPWPWFSHQHEVDIESASGNLTLFDNGNTRFAYLGGDSRGMVLQIDESAMQATPALSVDLGVYSSAVGSAQLLGDGNYFFMAGFTNGTTGYAIEVQPSPGTLTGTQVFNMSGTLSYRSWRMTSLYTPPAT